MMIKIEHIVIILSIIAGLFTGLIDTLVGYFIFSKGPFWDLLLFDVPAQEFYVRTFLLLSYIAFGVVISRFISKRRQAEIEAKKISENLQSLVKSSPLAIITYNADGQVLMWNPSAERIFGWNEQEVIGKKLPIVPEDKQEESRSLREMVLHGEHLSEIELVRLTKDGSRINVSISTAPVKDTKGNTTYTMAIFADITERKLAAKERERLILELQKALAEIKTLSGMLPICASCKKIRDDKGYWNKIEEYIKKHSEVEFTHSLCPKCAKKLYPEIFEKEE
jgi:PAS domain S-box-containing protein